LAPRLSRSANRPDFGRLSRLQVVADWAPKSGVCYRHAMAGQPAASAEKAKGAEDAAFGELGSTERSDETAEARARAEAGTLISPSFPIARKVALAVLIMGGLVLLPYAHESLRRFRVLTPGVSFFDHTAKPTQVAQPIDTVGEAGLPGETQDEQARGDLLDKEPVDTRGPIAKDTVKVPKAVPGAAPPIPIDRPEGLTRFFDKLMRVEAKEEGAIARILYYGDSIVASDFMVTGKIRRLLQERFGDAGHGYAIVANAYPGWLHLDVARKASSNWKHSKCMGPLAEDGLYGLGCVSFVSRFPDAFFSMGTSKEKWGSSVSSFELEYLEQPGGGSVDLIVDGEKKESLSTDGPEKKLKYHTVKVPDGPHTLEVRTTSEAPTRIFGMRMERDVPGVTLNSLGITGARARILDKQDDAHWAEVLKAAKPDLVVLAFGTNEVGDGEWAFDENGQRSKDPMGDYERYLKQVMAQVEAAVPESSFMLVGPPDMASDNPAERSKPMVPRIIKHQQNCAEERGWAYWNQFVAMGGAGSMWSWVQSGDGNKDMVHPTDSGGSKLGTYEYNALMSAYEAYKAKRR
jgi:lysophospholipase L1-like esterase